MRALRVVAGLSDSDGSWVITRKEEIEKMQIILNSKTRDWSAVEALAVSL